MCVGLSYGNSSVVNLEYKDMILKENLRSSIEIVENNILKEISRTKETIKTGEEFLLYFQESEFLDKIRDISNSQLNNITVEIKGKSVINNDVIIHIESKAKDGKYERNISCDIYIINILSKEGIYEGDIVKVTNFYM